MQYVCENYSAPFQNSSYQSHQQMIAKFESTGNSWNLRILREMKIRELQGPPVFGFICPIKLYLFLNMMLIGSYFPSFVMQVATFLYFKLQNGKIYS